MPTIYLSSTYEDLKDYRQAVYEALRKSGYDVIAMEEYVATDRRPVEKCLKDVEQADVYVGLFAFRYGFIPPQEHGNPRGLSITELEFRKAEELGKPSLAFVVKDTTPWARTFDDAHAAEDKGERIKAFRNHLLTEKLASAFSSPHELASLVQAAVTRYEKEREEERKEARQQDPQDDPVFKISTTEQVLWDIEKDGSPYPGLFHFTRKHASVYFGREADERGVLDRLLLQRERFLIISGDSGIGKSSVVDAGVLPKLEAMGCLHDQTVKCVRMFPGQASDPFSALMVSLGEATTRAGLRPEDIVSNIKQHSESLGTEIQNIIHKGTDRQTLVLFLDQMEELFTAQATEQANAFLSALYRATQEQALWVIATIRSDHLHYCHRHPDMVKVINGNGHYALGPVEPYMMEAMILKPAQAAGLTISESFAQRIIQETGSVTANLPLLAFVLDKLYEGRKDQELSETLYRQLGGVSGAIGDHVKSVEKELQTKLGVEAGNDPATNFSSIGQGSEGRWPAHAQSSVTCGI